MSISIILCACRKGREAKRITEKLLKAKLVACVSIIKIKSAYWWKNKITRNDEALMIIKTRKNLVNKTMKAIKRIHSYQIPEIIEIDAGKVNKEYIEWMKKVTE